MADCGFWSCCMPEQRRAPGVGRGKGRGVTKPPLRKKRRRK